MGSLRYLAVPLLAAVAHAQNNAASSSAASSGSSALPNLSSTSSAKASSSAAATSDANSATRTLPSLTGGSTSYSYPAPSVPPTADAPFMQKSNLPNGTVFICVGAALGFFFVLILAWRMWAAWMLHRRMNAANAQYVGVPSAPSGNSPKDKKLRKSALYQRDMGSELSMDHLTRKEHGGGGGKRHSKVTKGDASRQSTHLFFSPTAGAGAHGTTQQRASSYLPAGYYATAGSAVGSTTVNPNSTSDLSMRTGDRLSMADFSQPDRRSYGYKDSPLLAPQSGNGLEPPNLPFARNAGARNSVTSLSGSDRPPSAYLEDLFDSTPVKERRSSERDNWR